MSKRKKDVTAYPRIIHVELKAKKRSLKQDVQDEQDVFSTTEALS
ncbi:MAG: hypothetical protein ACOYYU_17120 [Chloroflexota bacterium]